MHNVFLQKDLGSMGDFMNAFKNDIKKEFLKNSKLPDDYFTKKQEQEKVSFYSRFKKVFSKITKGNWWDKTDFNDHLFMIGNWKMRPLYYNKKWAWDNYVDREAKVDGITFGTVSAYDLIKLHYPKTVEMLDKIREKHGDCINKATFSILTANGYISVHKGLENIHSEYIRCHIPIIIPEHKRDELYLEVNADKVHWTETFGFDNQTYHTATNKTPYNRLVFMIDISREALNMNKKEKVIAPFFTRLVRIIFRKGVNLN